jgi:hypothetical protein
MFALTGNDLQRPILGCADGPASFNAEATARGHDVISCDPIYRFATDQIRQRIRETTEVIVEQTSLNRHEFVWNSIRSVEELRDIRTMSMDTFLDDFDAGKRQGRYIVAELPQLPFSAKAFRLALCSHLLFLYAEQLSADFHAAAAIEMCRVADEVRIFPLIALGGARSRHVALVAERLEQAGHTVWIEKVDYEFQRGGNEMMRVRAYTTK